MNEQRNDLEEAVSFETAEVKRREKETVDELETISHIVGGDFGMKVSEGQEGGGSYFSPSQNEIVFDPSMIRDNPDRAKFIAGHEGAHRAISSGSKELGLTIAQEQEFFGNLGFRYMNNAVEDPSVNDWLKGRFPGFESLVKKEYDQALGSEGGAMVTPEVIRLAEQIGKMPLFAQYGTEIMRDWHKGKIGEMVDPMVKKALDRTLDDARKNIKNIPDPSNHSRREIVESAQKRFEKNVNYLWPEVKKLVEQDLHNEELRNSANEYEKQEEEMENEEKRKQQSEQSSEGKSGEQSKEGSSEQQMGEKSEQSTGSSGWQNSEKQEGKQGMQSGQQLEQQKGKQQGEQSGEPSSDEQGNSSGSTSETSQNSPLENAENQKKKEELKKGLEKIGRMPEGLREQLKQKMNEAQKRAEESIKKEIEKKEKELLDATGEKSGEEKKNRDGEQNVSDDEQQKADGMENEGDDEKQEADNEKSLNEQSVSDEVTNHVRPDEKESDEKSEEKTNEGGATEDDASKERDETRKEGEQNGIEKNEEENSKTSNGEDASKSEEKTGNNALAEKIRKEIEKLKNELEKIESGEKMKPLPLDELSPELKKALEKQLEKRSKEEREKYKEKAERVLEELEDKLNEELEGKLNEDAPENHEERRERNEKEVLSGKQKQNTSGMSGEMTKKELNTLNINVETLKINLTKYEKMRKDVASLADALYLRLVNNILKPEDYGNDETGYSTGLWPDFTKVMQAEHSQDEKSKLWYRENFPGKKDYRFDHLFDVSGSMIDPEEKIDETLKGGIVVVEPIDRLQDLDPSKISVRQSVAAFHNRYFPIKSTEERMTKKIEEKFASIVDLPKQRDSGTNTFKALEMTLAELQKDPGENGSFVFVYTDGEPNADIREELKALLKDGKAERKKQKIKIGIIWLGQTDEDEEMEELKNEYGFDFGVAMVTVKPSEEERRSGKKNFAEKLGGLLESIVENPDKY